MIRNSRILAIAPIFALLASGGCSSKPEAPLSPYSVRIDKGCFWDIDHNDYDPTLPGYWFVGTNGTLSMSLGKDAKLPESFSFMIKTRATATTAKPSRLEKVMLLTGRYQVLTAFGENGAAPVNIIGYFEKKEGKELVPVEQDKDGRFVKMEQVGERVKITITKRGLEVLGGDIILSWSESLDAAAKEEAADKLKTADRSRILMR